MTEYQPILSGQGNLELDLVSTVAMDHYSAVRFEQKLEGIPVFGGGLTLLVRRDGVVDELYSTCAPAYRSAATWELGEERAAEFARATVPYEPAVGGVRIERQWMIIESAAAPVWLITLTGREPHQSRLVVLSDRGELVEMRDLVHGQAQGFAYPTNPAVGRLTQVSLSNLTGNGTLSGRFARVFSYRPALLGVVSPTTTVQEAKSVNGVFPYQPDDPRFAEVQLYYGIDRIATKFQELGFPGLSQPISAVANYADFDPESALFVPQNNAFFSSTMFSGAGGIFFYLTSRNLDPSYDSDIVFHEYAHAVVNRFVPSAQQGETFRALNEAFADYFSDSFLNDPVAGEYAANIWRMRTPFVRTADNANRWPSHLVGGIHEDGNIWSGALWDIRKRLGPERADRIAMGALARLPGSAEFDDAAVAAATAAESLYGRTVADQVFSIMNARGLGTPESLLAAESVRLLSGQTVSRRIDGAPVGINTFLDGREFRINVPHQATRLNIDVVASGSVRAYIRYRAPVYVENGVVKYEQQTSTGTTVSNFLSLDNVPELQAGDYYIVVANTTSVAVNYTLRVTSVGGSPGASPAIAVVLPGTVARGSAPSGPFLASRQFAVDVPPGASRLAVSVQGSTDVDLYVNANRPVFHNSQGLPEADFVLATAARAESLVLDFASFPSVRPGRYYIAVVNFDSVTSQYTVQADISLAAPPSIQIIQATNTAAAIPLRAASGAALFSTAQVRFTVPAGTTSFRVQAVSAQDIDVVLRRGAPIQFQNGKPLFDYWFTPNANADTLTVAADSVPPLRADTYYATAVNYSPNTGTASLRVFFDAPPTAATTVIRSVNAAGDFGGTTSFASGSWIEIKGENLAADTRIWRGSDFVGGIAPTSLDGVSVTINGRPGFVYYISPTQLNVQAPADATLGSAITITVRTPSGSANFSSNKVPLAPGLLAPAAFRIGGRQYLAAQFSDGVFAGRPGLIAGVAFRAAKPADTLIVYGVGFGEVNPTIPPGVIADRQNSIIAPVSIQFGSTPATLLYRGLAPGFVGLYQFNIVVPDVADGDASINVSVNGNPLTQSLFLTVQR